MSDLYGTDDRSSFEPESEHGHDESEDMTVFLHNLLQSSPATASGGAPPSMMLDYRVGAPSLINPSSSVGAGGGGSFNFSDPGFFFGREAKERVEKAFYSVVGGECDAVTSSMKRGESSSLNKGSEACDSIMNQLQPRSSKRSRSAEVHNLSEKRRRSRINEKLKALQNLIPNSNKTDKASMLDEAIEYLKQLQLQVQMLTMRNGFSLHQNYIPGCLPPIQLPVEFDEGNILSNNNTSRGADVVVSGNQEVAMENVFGTDNPKGSSHQLLAPSITNNSSSGTSFRLESSSSFPSHYGLLNHLASSKEICRDETLSHLPLNVSCSGNNSSSGVSS